MNAELAERSLFQFAIGGMIFDPLRIAPEAVALVQHRDVAVGKPGAFIEVTTGETAEPVEMRFDMPKQFFGQVNAQQVGQRWIGAVKVHAGGIRRDQSGLLGRLGGVLLSRGVHRTIMLQMKRAIKP